MQPPPVRNEFINAAPGIPYIKSGNSHFGEGRILFDESLHLYYNKSIIRRFESEENGMPDSNSSHNPLGSLPINTLLPKFAIPSIVAYLVTSLYNIVDQIFIGQGVGYLGNAATNVAFPFTTVSTAIALMMGIGTAANFNLNLGAGNEERARRVAGTGLSCLALFSLTLGLIALFFRGPLLNLFGATPEVLPYAMIYTGITGLRPAYGHLYHRGQFPGPGRWKSHLLHALYPLRRGTQHHIGPGVYLRSGHGAWPGARWPPYWGRLSPWSWYCTIRSAPASVPSA